MVLKACQVLPTQTLRRALIFAAVSLQLWLSVSFPLLDGIRRKPGPQAAAEISHGWEKLLCTRYWKVIALFVLGCVSFAWVFVSCAAETQRYQQW